MLSSIRKFSKTFFAKILLVIVIIPFVFWGMGGVFSSGNTNSLAKINNVEAIEYINFSDKSEFLNLLSINYDKNFIMFNFSLDMIIKIKINNLKIFLDDIDLPWPTFKKPIHK